MCSGDMNPLQMSSGKGGFDMKGMLDPGLVPSQQQAYPLAPHIKGMPLLNTDPLGLGKLRASSAFGMLK